MPAPPTRPAQTFAGMRIACAAAMLGLAAGTAGDCTPVEAASYAIDPRGPMCHGRLTCDHSFSGHSDCAGVHTPPEINGRPTATWYEAQETAATACSEAGCGDHIYPVCTSEPVESAISTRDAAIALSSSQCAACAANYAPANTSCVVSKHDSCSYGPFDDFASVCVKGIFEQSYSPTWTDESVSNTDAATQLVYASGNTHGPCHAAGCLAQSTLADCKVRHNH